MARTRRIKAEGEAFYHVTSRITGKQFLLKDPAVKKLMLDALERSARFSGVRVGGFCIMDDHFHLLFQVPSIDPENLSETELLDRIEILSGKARADRLHDKWADLRLAGDTHSIEEEQQRWRRRMYDISAFMKTFKEEFRRAYQKKYEYSGRLWGDRFFSTLIEGAEYFSRCAAYVELNPVRAGMVRRATDYAWNTAGAALRGSTFAIACRQWLQRVAGVTGGISTCGDSPSDGEDSSPSEKWLLRQQPQIAKGKLLGSASFVNGAVCRFRDQLGSCAARARDVEGAFFASHGYRLAKRARNVA
jgi:REP element-mobilizing transposase RayT